MALEVSLRTMVRKDYLTRWIDFFVSSLYVSHIHDLVERDHGFKFTSLLSKSRLSHMFNGF